MSQAQKIKILAPSIPTLNRRDYGFASRYVSRALLFYAETHCEKDQDIE
jgi:hypothetical protein